MDDTKQTHTRYQRSDSEQLEVNVKLFSVIRKRNIPIKEKVKKIKKLLGKKPQPDINAQDGNDNWNTALHMAIKRNELEVVNFLFTEGADTTIENCDGKTPLQLAEECNHVEIIDMLKSCTSQTEWPPSETDRLASHTSQPVAANPNQVSVSDSNSQATVTDKQTASTVLLPLSGKLRVDKNLKLSNDDFKISREKYYANKQLSAINQLKATSPYPTPHVLSQFASMAYRDCKHTEPKPPDGWMLLTAASNFGLKNGYFGTAYWHPEYQQVVIAHRGTESNNVVAFFKDLYTDIKGVVHNKFVDQMSSASTFANKVVAVLQEIEQEKKVSFELFFTGHSLGGWLAQITAFTTEYLEVKGGTFLQKQKTEQWEEHASSTVQESHDVRKSYHPHTVAFDSPGCKDMLSQMADKFDVRLKGRSIDLQQLDIASFLSAPNRINTCNSHLGRVYRIFTDLSDMGLLGKKTLSYNLATHSMDKIVQAFDPETGKGKDDNGEPKILEVIDWPVSAGLRGEAEWKTFFKWADSLNNYHPVAMDTVPSEVPKGYHPLPYQTKAYDKCIESLSVFTQDELQFLERYHWLRDLKDFFKPEDLFSTMNNTEVKKEAEQKLQDFKLENESVRCPANSTLHTLIPFVKRLVRLFPQIKDKAKDQLSSAQIRNRVYRYETQRYVEKIRQSALDFNPSALGLREFLDSDQQMWQLQMTDVDAWTGITKVYRVLQNTSSMPSCFSEGHYTILELQRLLTVNRMIKLNVFLASMDKPHLLMIACGTNQPVNDELRDMFKGLFNVLKQKNNLKIILTAQSDDDTADFIQQIATETLGEGFITTDEQLTWSDLTDSSQIKMLEKTVIFQGRPVTLKQLTCAESITDSFPLADLLQEKELRIGEEPVPSGNSGYNEKYYIERTFNHNIVIRQNISTDEHEGKFADLLASTEQEFKQLCQQNPTSNVHWLEKDKSGELLWQQSQGNLQALRKYIDNQKSHSYALSDLDKLLQQAKHQRVMIIADKAGMGKTTVLTLLSKRIKQKFPAHWLVRIDLNNYTELFKAQKVNQMDKGRVLEFVSKEVLKLESQLEKVLFKKNFEGNEINKVVVMVDGFDEISPDYKETVLDMLEVLKQTSLEQMWVSTRPHLREDLEDNLQQLSYTLQPFSEFEQVEYLKNFWFRHVGSKGTDQDRLQVFATELIRKLAQSISDKDKQFTGIPLQTRMLAEAFEEDFTSFYHSEKTQPEFQHKLDLLGLYRRFIERKYDIYCKEKSKTQAGNVGAKEQRESYFKYMQEQHQWLALTALFTEDQMSSLQIDHCSTFSDEQLARIGIVQGKHEGKPQFIHRTFAEYFVADFLIKQLTKEMKQQNVLINIVLLRADYHVTRSFLNGLLEESKPSTLVLKEYGKKLDEQWNLGKVNQTLTSGTTELHTAAREDNSRIVGFLLDSIKSGEHLKATKKLLFAKDEAGQTACHMAAETNSVQALEKIWEWAEEVTSTLTYDLLLSQDKESKTAWQLAAEGGHIEVVEKLWGWAKEELPGPDLLKNKFLLSRDKRGTNAWHLAAMTGSVKILGKLWEWAKELQLDPEELRNEMLLSKDQNGQTAWHMAAEGGHVEVLEKLRNWTEEEKINPADLKSALFLSEHSSGLSAWHLAVFNGHIHVLQKLWDWAEELQITTNQLNTLLLATDRDGNTTIHHAAGTGSIELLGKLWAVCKKTKLNTDILCKLLIAAWHKAAAEGYLEVLERLWLWAGEVQQYPHNLKRRLLLAQNTDEESVWHMAATGGHVDVLEKLWGCAKEEKLNPHYLKSVLFLLEDSGGFSTWCHAVREDRVDVVQKLWGWAEELQLTADEIKSKLFLAVDGDGNSAIYWAALTGSLKVLDTLWGLCKERQLSADELSKLLIAAWHGAAAQGYLEMLERLWLWAGQVQINPHQLQRELILDQNKEGQRAWHVAAAGGHIEVLEKLWGWANGMKVNRENLKDKFFLDEIWDGKLSVQWANTEESGNLLGLSEKTQVNANDLRIVMFLARDKRGNTAWQMAVKYGRIMVLEKLLDLAQEMQLNRGEMWNKLLLDQEQNGRSAWFLAAQRGNVKVLEELWDLAKEKGNLEEIKYNLLLAQNEFGQTAWHVAAESSVAVLEKMWAFATEAQLNEDELLNKLLLAKDKYGYTAWLRAAEGGTSKALETLWNCVKTVTLNRDEMNKMLLAQNEEGETAWHLAAEGNDEEKLQKLWIWAKETQVNLKMFENKLLQAKDKYGNTVWNRAAKGGGFEALETLWCWVRETEINPDELLLGQDNNGKNILQVAAQRGDLGLIEKIWVWEKEVHEKNSKELKKRLILAEDNYGYIAWHQAAKCGRLEALEILWSWSKEVELNLDALLLAKTEGGETAMHMAAQGNHIEILTAMWVWVGERQLNTNELKKKLLLTKDKDGYNAWHTAALFDRLDALEILRHWVKEVELPLDEVLLAETEKGLTALHIAAQNKNTELLQKLWVWAEEGHLNTNELKKKLLLAKDKTGYIAWHHAANFGNLEALQTIWSLAKEVELNLDELLLAETEQGQTALHMAAEENYIEILHSLWVWAEEWQLNTNELKRKLFLAKDKLGYIAWHHAVGSGRLEALETLWSLAKELELNLDELLLAETEEGLTALHIAAQESHTELLQKLWVWAEEWHLNTNELKKKLLLAKDENGFIAWHHAASFGKLEASETLWSLAKEVELNLDELLLAETEQGQTALHMAAYNNHTELLEKLWVWAEEWQLNTNELKKKLLLAKDKHGYIAWHRAAPFGNLEALQTIWSLAKEVELNLDEILLDAIEEGEIDLHMAA